MLESKLKGIQSKGVTGGKGVGVIKGKEAKYMVMGDALTWSCGHISCIIEVYT